MAAGRFVRAAARLVRVLGEDRCAVAGGVAVNVHGYVRATRDVDMIVSVPLAEARQRLRDGGITARVFEGDPLEGEFSCLKGVVELGGRPVDAVPFDVLPPLVPFEPSRMVDLTVRGERLRVVDIETLLRLKLKAGGPKDLYDVAILVNLHPKWKARAEGLAAADREVAKRLKSLLADPRVSAQAREIERHDRIARARTRRG